MLLCCSFLVLYFGFGDVFLLFGFPWFFFYVVLLVVVRFPFVFPCLCGSQSIMFLSFPVQFPLSTGGSSRPQPDEAGTGATSRKRRPSPPRNEARPTTTTNKASRGGYQHRPGSCHLLLSGGTVPTTFFWGRAADSLILLRPSSARGRPRFLEKGNSNPRMKEREGQGQPQEGRQSPTHLLWSGLPSTALSVVRFVHHPSLGRAVFPGIVFPPSVLLGGAAFLLLPSLGRVALPSIGWGGDTLPRERRSTPRGKEQEEGNGGTTRKKEWDTQHDQHVRQHLDGRGGKGAPLQRMIGESSTLPKEE